MTTKITVDQPKVVNKIPLTDLAPGQMGIDYEGKVYLRTVYTATQLNGDGTYPELKTNSSCWGGQHLVTPIPIGTKFSLEVGEKGYPQVVFDPPLPQAPQDKIVTIKQMPAGSVGIDGKGNIYYRTQQSAACLNDPGMSFSNNAHVVDNTFVTLYPKGTKITIEVLE